jgi:DNA processing protein
MTDALAPKPGIHLTDEQRISWLQLIRSENIGPLTFRDLINHFGTADEALRNVPDLAARSGRRNPIRLASREDAVRELERIELLGAFTICMGEPDYPPALRVADSAPPVLTVRGSREVLARDAVAFVGSRNSSVAGAKFTRALASGVGQAGYCVVSGLARGIDAAAHEAALQTGTVAAFAGGVDVVYPERNEGLASAIIEHSGALVSEMPLGWKPRAQDFPRRNRIVAGMALGLVVVEAARRSGSLISARLASEMGRDVFAVPGSPLDPRSEGANHLIRNGATLITSADDILADIAPVAGQSKQASFALEERKAPARLEDPSDNDRKILLSAIGHTPTDVDDLIAHTGLAPGVLQMLLLELTLAGALERHSGNRVSMVQA